MTTATEVGYVEMRVAEVVGLATAEDPQPFHYVVRSWSVMVAAKLSRGGCKK